MDEMDSGLSFISKFEETARKANKTIDINITKYLFISGGLETLVF